MQRTILVAVSLMVCLSVPAFAAEPKIKEKDAEHAAAKAAKPGSHEDWCSEHGVAESQCTRCDSSLIPAFKATGDWCKKHGLPNSHCKKCNPNLKIVRPPKGK